MPIRTSIADASTSIANTSSIATSITLLHRSNLKVAAVIEVKNNVNSGGPKGSDRGQVYVQYVILVFVTLHFIQHFTMIYYDWLHGW